MIKHTITEEIVFRISVGVRTVGEAAIQSWRQRLFEQNSANLIAAAKYYLSEKKGDVMHLKVISQWSMLQPLQSGCKYLNDPEGEPLTETLTEAASKFSKTPTKIHPETVIKDPMG